MGFIEILGSKKVEKMCVSYLTQAGYGALCVEDSLPL